MKICWLADYTVETYNGGAQYSNAMYIDAGKKLGHKIDVVTWETGAFQYGAYDLVIVNNIQKFTEECLEMLKEIISKEKYMMFVHDYWALGNSQEAYPDIFKRSIKNMFLTKMHMKYHKDRGVENADYNTSPIDTKKFVAKGKKNNRLAVWVGGMNKNKGLFNLLKYARIRQDLMIECFGPLSKDMVVPPNVKIVGEVVQDELVKSYQKARYFIALPNWIEPFGRAVVEAYLCGCDLIVNENIGVMGEGWNWGSYASIKKKLHTEKAFWRKVENAVYKSG